MIQTREEKRARLEEISERIRQISDEFETLSLARVDDKKIFDLRYHKRIRLHLERAQLIKEREYLNSLNI